MGRLIDDDALIEALNLAEWFYVADFNEAVYAVKKAIPVDAVKVVRCGECNFWDRDHISCEGLAKCLTGESGIRYRNRSDFCSKGVLKGGDHAEGTIQKERS